MPPLSGVAGIYGAEIVRAASIACDEINEAGGLLGRRVELVVEDDGSLPETAVAAAQKLAAGGCAALIGNLLSNSRISVAYRVAEPRQIPYLNFSFYEGSISSPYFFHFAALPNQQIDRMIPYMRKHFGPRIYFAGNNYEWARGSIAAAKAALAKVGGVPVGEDYFTIGIGEREIDALLDDLTQTGPDVFVPYFVGADQMAVLSRLTDRGLKERMAVVTGHFDEMMASLLPPAVREGCYASNTYFSSVENAENRAFRTRLASFSDAGWMWPAGSGIVTNFGEGAYICVKAFAAAAAHAQSLDAADMIAALENVVIKAPQGIVEMRSAHHHAKVNSYLARCGADGVMHIMEVFGPVEPELPKKYAHRQAHAAAVDFFDLRLRAHVLDGMNEAVMLVSASDRRVLYCNDGAERLFGYASGEMRGCFLHSLINAKKTSVYSSYGHVADELNRRGEWRGDVRIVMKTGEQNACTLSASALTHPLHGETWLCSLAQTLGHRTIEKALNAVAGELGGLEGKAYYEAVVRSIASLLNVEFAFVSIADSLDEDILRTAAYLADGEIAPNITYSMLNTPCRDARTKGFVLIPRDACQLYPRDTFIADLSITAYAGVALIGRGQQFLGLAGIMSRNPLPNADVVRSVLQVFAMSITATIDRVSAVGEKALALINSEANLRAIANNSLVGILIIGEGQFQFANLFILELLGYSSQEMRRLSLDAIMHRDSREQLLRAFTKPVADRISPELLSAHLVTKDGRPIAAEIKVAATVWNNNLSTMAFVIDLSERQQAEEELKEAQRELVEAQQQYIDLFEYAPDGLVLTDQEGTIRLVNQQAELIFGWPREELVGMAIETLMPMGARSAHRRYRRDFFKTSSRRQMAAGLRSLQGRRKDGTEFPAEIDLAPVTSRSGLMVAAVVRDVTQQRALEEQLAHSGKMDAIGKLTGGMAHDFNNYLGIIISNLDLLTQKDLDPQSASLLDQALWGATSAAELTQSLLAFARRQSLSPKLVRVNEIISTMSLILKATVGDAITLEFDLCPGIWDVLVDRTQFESCIINLATNARDAMPKGGKMRIATRNSTMEDIDSAGWKESIRGEHVILSISDNGGGMTSEVLAQAFEPFFTTKSLGQGTGLGLSSVYGFVKQSGGNIQIKSQPGAGTTVKICLPRAVHAHATPAASSAALTMARHMETVLVVDDRDLMRSSLRQQLEFLGYSVLEAEGGLAALELLFDPSLTIHVLLTDIVMPGEIDGIELAKRALKRRPDLKVIATSGMAELRIGEDSSLQGVVFLPKPYRVEELAHVLSSIVNREKT